MYKFVHNIQFVFGSIETNHMDFYLIIWMEYLHWSLYDLVTSRDWAQEILSISTGTQPDNYLKPLCPLLFLFIYSLNKKKSHHNNQQSSSFIPTWDRELKTPSVVSTILLTLQLILIFQFYHGHSIFWAKVQKGRKQFSGQSSNDFAFTETYWFLNDIRYDSRSIQLNS